MSDEIKRRNHATGAVAALLAQEKEFKDRQAPRVEIPGLGNLRPVPADEPSETKPAEKSQPVSDGSSKASDKFSVRMIPSEIIKPWAFANRPESEFGDWDAFVRSISKDGVQIPIHVRPDAKKKGEFEVIAGQRRWTACFELGIPVPCFVNPYTDQEAAALQQLENDERDGVSAWANATVWDRYMREGAFKSQLAMAASFNVDRSRISDLMAYTRIDPKVKKAIGGLTKVKREHATVLAAIKADQTEKAADQLKGYIEPLREGKLTVRKLKEILSGQPDKPKPKVRKVHGIERYTFRKDSNGTPTFALLKGLLEVMTADEADDLFARAIEAHLSGQPDKMD